MTRVQAAHFSPDAPQVDVIVDNEPVFENLDFRDVSELAELDQGDYNIEIRPSGSEDSVLKTQLTLDADTHYTVVASGLLSDDDLELTIISHEE